MLKLKEFEGFKVSNTVMLKGGAPVRTDGGRHVVLMQSFDYGHDVTDTDRPGWTKFCDITNSTMPVPPTAGGTPCDTV